MLSSTTSSESAQAQTRVLLVDDNQAILSRARAVLAPASLVVGQAHDGEAALSAAASLRPDVIVLDISMPGMSGFEVAAELRKAGSTAAIVFLTVHDDAAFIEAAQASGVLGYVIKSRLVSDLPHAVREALACRPFVSMMR